MKAIAIMAERDGGEYSVAAVVVDDSGAGGTDDDTRLFIYQYFEADNWFVAAVIMEDTAAFDLLKVAIDWEDDLVCHIKIAEEEE